MRKVNINIEQFLREFNDEYNFLYENDYVAGYEEAIEEFDNFAKQNGSFIYEFVKYRGDFISSDREAAAFMFAMGKYM